MGQGCTVERIDMGKTHSNGNGTSSKLLIVLFGVLSTVAIGLASFSLKWQFAANARMEVMASAISTIQGDTKDNLRQDESIAKHWRLLSWTRDRLNELKTALDQPIVSWPD